MSNCEEKEIKQKKFWENILQKYNKRRQTLLKVQNEMQVRIEMLKNQLANRGLTPDAISLGSVALSYENVKPKAATNTSQYKPNQGTLKKISPKSSRLSKCSCPPGKCLCEVCSYKSAKGSIMTNDRKSSPCEILLVSGREIIKAPPPSICSCTKCDCQKCLMMKVPQQQQQVVKGDISQVGTPQGDVGKRKCSCYEGGVEKSIDLCICADCTCGPCDLQNEAKKLCPCGDVCNCPICSYRMDSAPCVCQPCACTNCQLKSTTKNSTIIGPVAGTESKFKSTSGVCDCKDPCSCKPCELQYSKEPGIWLRISKDAKVDRRNVPLEGVRLKIDEDSGKNVCLCGDVCNCSVCNYKVDDDICSCLRCSCTECQVVKKEVKATDGSMQQTKGPDVMLRVEQDEDAQLKSAGCTCGSVCNCNGCSFKPSKKFVNRCTCRDACKCNPCKFKAGEVGESAVPLAPTSGAGKPTSDGCTCGSVCSCKPCTFKSTASVIPPAVVATTEEKKGECSCGSTCPCDVCLSKGSSGKTAQAIEVAPVTTEGCTCGNVCSCTPCTFKPGTETNIDACTCGSTCACDVCLLKQPAGPPSTGGIIDESTKSIPPTTGALPSTSEGCTCGNVCFCKPCTFKSGAVPQIDGCMCGSNCTCEVCPLKPPGGPTSVPAPIELPPTNNLVARPPAIGAAIISGGVAMAEECSCEDVCTSSRNTFKQPDDEELKPCSCDEPCKCNPCMMTVDPSQSEPVKSKEESAGGSSNQSTARCTCKTPCACSFCLFTPKSSSVPPCDCGQICNCNPCGQSGNGNNKSRKPSKTSTVSNGTKDDNTSKIAREATPDIECNCTKPCPCQLCPFQEEAFKDMLNDLKGGNFSCN